MPIPNEAVAMTESEINQLAEKALAAVAAALWINNQAGALAKIREAIKQAVDVTAERKDDEFQER